MECNEHCEKSMELFGENGELFHKWLDSYKPHGYRHRQVLHNKEGVEIGVQFFGETARRHLEQHIKDDLQTDRIPSCKELRQKGRSFQPLQVTAQ